MKIYIKNKKEVIDNVEVDIGDRLIEFMDLEIDMENSSIDNFSTVIGQIRKGNDIEENLDELREIMNYYVSFHEYFKVFQELVEEKAEIIRKASNEELVKTQVSDIVLCVLGISHVQMACRYLVDSCFNIDKYQNLTISDRGNLYLMNTNLKGFIVNPAIIPPITLSVIDKELVKIMDAKTLIDIININFLYLFDNKIYFRKCKNCGEYFVLEGASNIQYCDRLVVGSKKTCREIGAIRQYQKKAFDNPVAKLYNREYKKRFARIKYGMTSKDEFKSWANIAREKRDECIKGKITIEEFVFWLDNN